MSNQRVVVLTDDEIESFLSQYTQDRRLFDAENKLRSALEHPEGISGEMIVRAREKARELSEAEDDEIAVVLEHDDWESFVARRVLEAALFPREGER